MKKIIFAIAYLLTLTLVIILGWIRTKFDQSSLKEQGEQLDSIRHSGTNQTTLCGVNGVYMANSYEAKLLTQQVGGAFCDTRSGDIWVNLDLISQDTLEAVLQHEEGHRKYHKPPQFQSGWIDIWKEVQADWNISKKNKIKMIKFLLEKLNDADELNFKLSIALMLTFRVPALLLGYLIKR